MRHSGVGDSGVVIFRSRLDGGQRALVGSGGGVNDALQGAERIGTGAAVRLGNDGIEHGAQVVTGDTRQADQGQVGRGQRRVGCAAGSCGLDGVGNAGERVDLGDGVYTGRGLRTHDVVEQGQVFGVGGCGADVRADEGVQRWCGVAGGVGIRQVAVGFGQHRVVGVDDGLQFGGAVGFDAVHSQAGQCVVDGMEVVGNHSRDACDHVVAQRGHCACGRIGQPCGVGLCKGAEGVQGVGVASDGRVNQTLQFSFAGDGCAIGIACRDGGQHGGQVVGGHGMGRTRAASQAVDLTCCRGSLPLGSGVGDGGRHGVGQGLHRSNAVHIGHNFGSDHLAQQGGFGGRVHPSHADSGVLGLGGIGGGGVSTRTIGFAEDGGVGIHNGLHFGHGVGGCAVHAGAVECAVDGGQVGAVHAVDAGFGIDGGVGGGGRGVVGLCSGLQGAERGVDHEGGGADLGDVGAQVACQVGAGDGHGVGAVFVHQCPGQGQVEATCSGFIGADAVAACANRVIRGFERETERVARFAAAGQRDLVLQAIVQFGMADAVEGFGQAEHRRRNGGIGGVHILARGLGVECEALRSAGFAGVARHVGGGRGEGVGAVFCDLVRRHGDGG